MSETQVFVGIDVAKAQLDIALRPTGDRWAVPNEEASIAALVAQLQAAHPTLIVLEATGGYQRAVVAALAAAGLPVVVVNPRQTRDFAKATGQLAKTDTLDARALAHFAEAVRPPPRPLPDAQTEDLRALLTRRRQLVAMRTAERNRLDNAPRRVQATIEAHLAWLDAPPGDPRRRPRHDAARQSRLARARDPVPQCARHWARLCADAAARPARVGHAEPPADCRLGRRRPVQLRQWHHAGPPRHLGRPGAPARHAVYGHAGGRPP